MARRDFIKKTALVTASSVIVAPVTAMLANAETAGLIKSEAEPTSVVDVSLLFLLL